MAEAGVRAGWACCKRLLRGYHGAVDGLSAASKGSIRVCKGFILY